MTNIADLPDFDMAEWLPDEAGVAEYLTVVMEENDPAALAKAQRTIARARDMTEMAAKTRIGREALCKALTHSASTRYKTILGYLRRFELRW
ncbi:addiction module antidote protein [Ottowia sp. SB7-C50]|uniref:addiction module antidote protein n=1 Tax=Ottowia sp. SB7-C50 TaxID=3081231 RepID=UPI00295434D4|nr:addiction module antidote protein [Ottowia sp. SB7-C50]WOP16954.1 putative addiction module antidote protein [Ottowia sp. SB7-C50]